MYPLVPPFRLHCKNATMVKRSTRHFQALRSEAYRLLDLGPTHGQKSLPINLNFMFKTPTPNNIYRLK